MKRKGLFAVAIALSVFMTGCSGKSAENDGTKSTSQSGSTEALTDVSSEQETEKETVTKAQSETVQTTEAVTEALGTAFSGGKVSDLVNEEYLSQAMQFMKYADSNAVADVIRRAQEGEKLTIACIGGSITMGTISSGDKDASIKDEYGSHCYADIFFDWWKSTFPDNEFEFINAGIGATGSYLGVHRVETDVLEKKPDLVVVEFTVNDSGVKGCTASYENLVRKIRSSEGNPAVICLFMGMTNGSSALMAHRDTALYYNIPNIDYVDMIKAMMKDGTYTDKELAGDGVHPTVLGHAITGELLGKYLNSVCEELDTLEHAGAFDDSRDFHSEEKYMSCEILDSKSITPDNLGTFEESKVFDRFPNDWTSSEGDGGLEFTASFKNLGVLYFRITGDKGAKYDVYVDGECVATLDGSFKGGWGNYAESEEVYTSDEIKEHKVVFKKSADAEGDIFSVLALMISK